MPAGSGAGAAGGGGGGGFNQYCKLCDVKGKSAAVWERHVQGTLHQRNLAAARAGLPLQKPKRKVKTNETPPNAGEAAPKSKKDRKANRAAAEAAADPVQHSRLLAELERLLRTRPEDEVLAWLTDQLVLTPAEHQQRIQLCHELQEALRSRFRTCLVQAFGSSVSGLGFRGCDLDLYTYIDQEDPDCNLSRDTAKLRAAARIMQRLPQCANLIRIPRARVSILKFTVPALGDLKCDMSFRDPMSSQNSRLLRWLMEADGRARLVTVTVRYWAKRRRLAGGDAHPLKLNSYCLTLMVVTFLQQLQPPVLPTVDWCQRKARPLLIGPWNASFDGDAVWRSNNNTPASQLLRQFFRFYAQFPAETEALCPLLGGPLRRSLLTDRDAGRQLARHRVWSGFCDLVAAGRVEPLAADTALVVQDPMELNYNVARTFQHVGLDRFRECCQQAIGLPFVRLFDEQELPKGRMRNEEAAKERANALRAAAVETGPGDGLPSPRAVKRSSGDGSHQDGATEAKKVKLNGDAAAAARTVVAAVTAAATAIAKSGGGAGPAPVTMAAAAAAGSASDAKPNASAKSSGGGTGPAAAAAGAASGAKPNASAKSSGGVTGPTAAAADAASDAKPNASAKSSGGGGTGPAAASAGSEGHAPKPIGGPVLNVTFDPVLCERMVAELQRPPSRVTAVPLEVPVWVKQRAEVVRRHIAAFARFLEEVFSVVLRFECHTLTMEGVELGVAREVMRAFLCLARLPTWEHRKAVMTKLVDRPKTLQFESEVTERALRMFGSRAPTPLAAFCCYLTLKDNRVELLFYDGETAKAGKNCHPFVASYLQELCKRQLYLTMLDKDQMGKK